MNKTNLVFVAACLGMLLFGVSLITLGSIATFLKSRFDLGGIELGTLFSILPFGILLGSFIFGPVADRYGYKLLLTIACFGMFAGFEGIAYSSTLIMLKVCIFIIGVCGGVLNGGTNAVVADISPTNKGANLSLLGVFFGLGSLGMPLVLRKLSSDFDSLQVIAGIGVFTFLISVLFFFVPFPAGKTKKEKKVPSKELLSGLLLLIAIFLFFQSSLEAIINNWTTTYMVSRGTFTEDDALEALSLHIVGMVVMRLITGSIFRSVSQVRIMWICLLLLFAGILLMQVGDTYWRMVVGLILTGAGLAGGFPVMLGFVAERFGSLSGTAFSFVFVIALIGNMLINYIMGLIVELYGVHHLITVSYIEWLIMTALFMLVVRKLEPQKR